MRQSIGRHPTCILSRDGNITLRRNPTVTSNSKASDAEEQPLAKYKFGDGISPGDIILSTARHSTASAVIRLATRSAFSHAALYRAEMNVVEAVGLGITNYNITRVGIHDKRNVRVLRLVPECVDRGAIIEKAIMAVEKYRGRGYWTAGAVRSVIGNPQEDTKGRMFCSYFVAQVYKDAGLSLCRDIPPQDVTPARLSKSEFLVDCTDNVLVEIPAWQHKFKFDSLDLGHRTSPNQEILVKERELLAKVTPEFLRAGLRAPKTFDDILSVLLAEAAPDLQPKLDVEVMKALDDAELENLFRMMVGLGEAADDGFPVLPADMPLSGLGATIGLHREIFGKLLNRLREYEEEADAGKELVRRTNLKVCRLFLRRTEVKIGLLYNALVDLRATIAELEEVYRRRTAVMSSGNS